jgi:glycogen(starch) synthase
VSGELRVALVSREVYPFGGGGLGNYVTWTAELLSEVADVTVITTSRHKELHDDLCAAGDTRLPSGVRFEFVDEPPSDKEEIGSYYGFFHLWSARTFEALCRLYPDGGPDLVEFPDYHGEGAVTAQARRTQDPRLRNTCMCVRLNTSSEMCHVLDGHVNRELDFRVMYELERYSLRYADRVIWPGGDVLGTYRRFYGARSIGPPARIRHAVALDGDGDLDVTPDLPGERGGEPLRLLYMGRLERRKGVHNLVRALLSLERGNWSLTIVGGDTTTGPMGTSMRGQLQLLSGNDSRIRFIDSVPRQGILELARSHDVCVVPSLWECWPNVALEALREERPVLATPTGGLVEMVRPGESGWLLAGTGQAAIAAGLECLLDPPESVTPLHAGGPRAVFDQLTDRDEIRERYIALAAEHRARSASTGRRPRRHPPLVSVVITYYELEAYVEEALTSILHQRYPNLEVIMVNDGSLRAEDRVLDELVSRYPVTVVTQPNSGLPAARNFGIAQSRGKYVLPFDADNVADPALIERCVEALEADSELAYVTTWSQFIDERGTPIGGQWGGYQPLGNSTSLVNEQAVAGDATCLIRRSLFDGGFAYNTDFASLEDWFLYRELHRAGLYGHVIPERLVRYRVRRGSMIRAIGVPEWERFMGEMEAHEREQLVDWTAAPRSTAAATASGAPAETEAPR